MQFQSIEFQTKAYYQSLALRYEVLRKPLGLHFSEMDLVPDQTSLHFVGIKDNQVVACLILSQKSKKAYIDIGLNELHPGQLNKIPTIGDFPNPDLVTNLDPIVFKMRQVAVLGNLQGKGVGKKLVQFVEIEAKKKGITHFELNARKSAVSFYLSMNYSIEGDEFEEVGIPHIKMKKVL
jgi:predicted GNAT family N-acyltransferase